MHCTVNNSDIIEGHISGAGEAASGNHLKRRAEMDDFKCCQAARTTLLFNEIAIFMFDGRKKMNNSNVSNAFPFCAYLDHFLSVVLGPPCMLLRVCIITPVQTFK